MKRLEKFIKDDDILWLRLDFSKLEMKTIHKALKQVIKGDKDED